MTTHKKHLIAAHREYLRQLAEIDEHRQLLARLRKVLMNVKQPSSRNLIRQAKQEGRRELAERILKHFLKG